MKVLCTKWLLESNHSIGYVCPGLNLSKKFFKDLTAVIPPKLLTISNGSDLVIQSITGSTLSFFSAEQSNRIRGNTFDYLILDEVAFFKEDKQNHIWYSVLQPATKVKGKKIILVSTPNGKDNFFYDMAQLAINGKKGYSYIKRTIYDDAFINDIDELKSQTPDLAWKQEYLCEFIDGSGSYFTNYHQCYIDDMIFNANEPLWAGIDWSSTGKDETILTFINKSNQIKQYKIEGSLDNKYQQIADLINKYNPIATYAESNSIGSVMINELKKLTTKYIKPFTTTNESKTEIITELALQLEKGQLVYNDIELDRQLGAFGYSITKSKKIAFNGVKEHDDRCLSLAFALKAKKDNPLYNQNKIVFI